MGSLRPFEIDDARRIAALASPVRQEVVDAAVALGPFSIAELAFRLGRPADALYFHVRRLERVGLLRRVGERGHGRDRAAVYDLPGRPLRIRYGAASSRVRRIGPVLDAALRLARRDTRRALARADAVVDGAARNTWCARARGWLDGRGLRRANRLLGELLAVLDSGGPRRGAVPVALVFSLTPLEARSSSRRSRTRDGRAGTGGG